MAVHTGQSAVRAADDDVVRGRAHVVGEEDGASDHLVST